MILALVIFLVVAIVPLYCICKRQDWNGDEQERILKERKNGK